MDQINQGLSAAVARIMLTLQETESELRRVQAERDHLRTQIQNLQSVRMKSLSDSENPPQTKQPEPTE